MNDNNQVLFTMDTRLIHTILGSEMIESHSIAFAEQIKNARDAGATNVVVDFSKIREDKIIIFDDGIGMSENEIRKDWFVLGNSTKTDVDNLSGGKGIGRLSLFKIGNIFEIMTMSDNGGYSFSVSKANLQNNKPFLINKHKNDSVIKRGTKIVISDLDANINLKEIELELENLKHDTNNLKIEYIYPDDFVKTNFLVPSDVKPFVPFSAVIIIENGVIDYRFTSQLEGNVLYDNNNFVKRIGKEISQLLDDNNNFIELGRIEFVLWNFFFDNKLKLQDIVKGKSIEKYFLSAYQGINIYRNGFKIYGHGKNDWLKLAELRLKKSAENIDNKQSYGSIFLSSDSNKILKEKSSREGFLREGSYPFQKLILCLVRQFGQDRQIAVKIIKSETTKSETFSQQNEISFDKNNEQSTTGSLSLPKSITFFQGNDIDLVKELKIQEVKINEIETRQENPNINIKNSHTVDGKSPSGEYILYLTINNDSLKTIKLYIESHVKSCQPVVKKNQYSSLILDLKNLKSNFLNKLFTLNEKKNYSDRYEKQIEVIDALLGDLEKEEIDIGTVALCQILMEISFRAFYREYNEKQWKEVFPNVKNNNKISYDDEEFDVSNMAQVYKHLVDKETKKIMKIGNDFDRFYQPYNVNKHSENCYIPTIGINDFKHFFPVLSRLYELILKLYSD